MSVLYEFAQITTSNTVLVGFLSSSKLVGELQRTDIHNSVLDDNKLVPMDDMCISNILIPIGTTDYRNTTTLIMWSVTIEEFFESKGYARLKNEVRKTWGTDLHKIRKERSESFDYMEWKKEQ